MALDKIVLSVDNLNSIHLDRDEHSLYLGGSDLDYFLAQAGTEHYRLLNHIGSLWHGDVVIDLGTFLGASALALAKNNENFVYSYDVKSHLTSDYSNVKNIQFRIGNIFNSKKDLDLLLSSAVVLLDTFHDGLFEQQICKFLSNSNWKGILIADDINLNDEMKTWWNDIHHTKYDATKYGHFSGTGIICFGDQLIEMD